MFKNLKIKNKLIVAFLIVSILPIIGISFILYDDMKGYLLKSALNEEENDLTMKKDSIKVFLDSIEEELLFLSQIHSLQSIINTDDLETIEKAKERLAHNFLTFSKERGVYYQLRYIDENGQEVVRVDNDSVQSYLIEEDQLQNKAGRYYFEDTMGARKGTIFVSPLDLNIEQDNIENRGTNEDPEYVPVIRYGTPVFADNGDSKGIVIINVYADRFLERLSEVHRGIKQGKEIYLINTDGYFLHHPDSSKEWGFMFDNDETIDKYCSDSGRFFTEEEGQFYSPDLDCFLTFKRIYPSGDQSISSTGSNKAYSRSISKIQGSDYYWVLVSRVDSEVIYGTVNQVLYKLFAFIVLIIFIIFLVAIFLSNSISSPIKKLIKGIAIIKGGNLDYKVQLDRKDEIGELSLSFDDMTSKIKDSRKNIDKKVKKQTREIVSKSKDLEKQQLAILNILEDVEEEKENTVEVARDLEKFKLAVENASDHIVITDNNGICLYVNKGAELITGFSQKEVLGKKVGTKDNWGGLMPKEFYNKLWRTIKIDKKTFSGDVKNKRKNGEEYEAYTSVSPVLDEQGKVRFFVGIERDVTKEKQIDRAKSEFVSLASHQLRTPLSTINWYAEMLLAEDAGKINDEQREYLEEVYKGNQRMVDLVNALLNASRIDLGTLAVDPESTDLIGLANSVINEIKPQVDQKKQKIIKKFGKTIPKIVLDPKLMRIVFQNYLSNAIKYTPDKGKIEISIKKQKSEVLLSVKDNGMGIPKHQQKKIFTKLFRADNVREKETDGTGLGLYIVKAVIEQFGGKVWFESIENKGATFYATVPLKGVKAKEGSKGLEYTK